MTRGHADARDQVEQLIFEQDYVAEHYAVLASHAATSLCAMKVSIACSPS
jgi:hypothetical protein